MLAISGLSRCFPSVENLRPSPVLLQVCLLYHIYFFTPVFYVYLILSNRSSTNQDLWRLTYLTRLGANDKFVTSTTRPDNINQDEKIYTTYLNLLVF